MKLSKWLKQPVLPKEISENKMKPPKQKSLGQIAFEKSVEGRAYYNDQSWADLSQCERDEWTDIARAVSTAVRARQKRKKNK